MEMSVMQDVTGEELYRCFLDSDHKIAPGMSIGRAELSYPLEKGVYAATLNIQLFGSLTEDAQGEISVAFQMIAE